MTLDDFISRLENVKRAGEGFTARCPAHDDRQNSLSVGMGRNGGIVVCCHAGCRVAEIVEAMTLTMRDLAPPGNGKPKSLRREIKATYDYTNAAGELIFQVVRFEPKDFLQRRPDPNARDGWTWKTAGVERPLYRLSAVLAAVAAGETIYVTEGEKSANRLVALGLTATCSPCGAGKWRRHHTETLRAASRIVVFPDEDEPGRRHAATVAAALPQAVVVAIPGLKPGEDVYDYLDAGHGRADLQRLVEEAAQNPGPATAATDDDGDPVAALAAATVEVLNNRPGRALKQEAARAIVDWALDQGRLGRDLETGEPLWLADDGAVWALADGDEYRGMIAALGINGIEVFAQWLLSDLRVACGGPGAREVTLRRYAALIDGALYISCGARGMVRVRPDGVDKLVNGADHVYFLDGATWPAWRLTTPRAPATVRALAPRLEAPAECAQYTAEQQARLLAAWLVGAFVSMRPLPLVAALGVMNSGKTTTMRAVLQLLRGADADVITLPEKQRDAESVVTSRGVCVFDNADAQDVFPWLGDLLCQASTGARVEVRKLYTDGQLVSKPITAALALTSRTPAWAGRADVQDRVLPLFFGERTGHADDGELKAEVADARDAILSWCVEQARSWLASTAATPGRFVAFGRLVNDSDAVANATRAARVAVCDLPALVDALLQYGEDITGTPAEIVAALKAAGHELPYIGGGQAIGNLLREHRRLFERFFETKRRGRTYFAITPGLSVSTVSTVLQNSFPSTGTVSSSVRVRQEDEEAPWWDKG